jgi:hypothetical protein
MLSTRRSLLAVYMKLLYSRFRNQLFWNVITVSLCQLTADRLLTNSYVLKAAC